MPHINLVWSEARRQPRINLPSGFIIANCPPPKVYNWFLHYNTSLELVNLSPIGIGLLSPREIAGELQLRVITPSGSRYLINGSVCHQQELGSLHYHGLCCGNDNAALANLYKSLISPSRRDGVTVCLKDIGSLL